MKKIIIFIFCILMFLMSHASDWRTYKYTSEFDGKTQWVAATGPVRPTRELDWPYEDLYFEIFVVCNDAGEKWAMLTFSAEPVLNQTEIEDGYSVVKSRIKFDDTIDTATMHQPWGSEDLHFAYDDWAIQKLREAENVMLELNWYGEGRVIFKTGLSGSGKTFDKIFSNCSR